MATVEFKILPVSDQQFSVSLNGKRCTMRIRYNTSNNRWSFNLALDDVMILHGRRIVMGIDLVAAFDFDIGVIFAGIDADINRNREPGWDEMVGGIVKLCHTTLEDIDAAEAVLAQSEADLYGVGLQNSNQPSRPGPSRFKN
jgi:hypothetical protein